MSARKKEKTRGGHTRHDVRIEYKLPGTYVAGLFLSEIEYQVGTKHMLFFQIFYLILEYPPLSGAKKKTGSVDYYYCSRAP